MPITTKINTETIRHIAQKRHRVELSEAEAEQIHEKIIQQIGETLEREILERRHERQT